ncbi:MAG: hypothetical protein J5J00_08965 [Deltaproteobacteria bacterium]|nr:hypothetical protein [Deltaproteobacteria bacterium]
MVRTGDQSLHREWLREGHLRNFDILISYYGTIAGRFQEEADYYHEERGPKYPSLARLLIENSELLSRYAFIAMPDDDLRASTQAWYYVFEICKKFRLDLAQPSVTGHYYWPCVAQQTGKLLRFGNFVEIMTPVFSCSCLETMAPFFKESVSGFGLDHLWGHLLTQPQHKLAIIDAVSVHHTRPPKTGILYDALKSQGVNAEAEDAYIRSKFQIPQTSYLEYMSIPLDLRAQVLGDIPLDSFNSSSIHGIERLYWHTAKAKQIAARLQKEELVVGDYQDRVKRSRIELEEANKQLNTVIEELGSGANAPAILQH